MHKASLDDPARERALARSELLDSPPEPAFDRLTALAARLLRAPAAAVSLVQAHRQFFKSQVGMTGEWFERGTPIKYSFCQHVATSAAPLVVDDSRVHPTVHDNPAVTELDAIAYAGMPIADPDGNVLGSLCVIDSTPRHWSRDELEILDAIAQSVTSEIGLRAMLRDAAERESELRLLQQVSVAIVGAADFDGALRTVLAEICDATGWSYGEVWLPRHAVHRLERSPVWYATTSGLDAFAAASAALTLAPGEDLPGRAWSLGTTAWSNDLAAEPNFQRGDVAAQVGFRVGVAVPVLVDGQVLAVLAFHSTTPRESDGRYVDLVSTLAAQLGVVIRQKRIENVLQLQTVRLREQAQLIELASDAIVVRTWDGEVVYWNTGAEVLFGRTRGEAIGETVHTLLRTEFPRPYGDICRELERTGRWEGEVVHRLPDGSRVTVESRWALHRDAHGRPTQVLELGTNVSERRRTEEERDRLSRQLELILRSVEDGICGVDAEGRVTFVNVAAQRMLGHDVSDLVGRQQHPIIHHSYADGTPYPVEACPLWRTLQSGESNLSTEEVFWRKDGSSFPVEFRSSPLMDDEGIIGAVVAFRDISDRLRAERELIRAKDEAERANRIKSEFLANMSHEIRTPMNGIIGMAELLLDTPLDRRQREHLEMVRTSAESLLRIINEILDFSKIEAGRLELEHAPFSLRDAIGDTVRAHTVRAQQKGLAVSCEVAREVPDSVVGDVGRVRQIIVNLLSNAIKFTATGEVSVRVAVANVPIGPNETVLHVSVRDTGIGIPRARQQAIFEAFTQADSSTTREFGGTGLGLTISSQLVRLMGGRIWVESWPGRGSTFHFTVRAGLAPVGVPRRMSASDGAAPGAAGAGDGDAAVAITGDGGSQGVASAVARPAVQGGLMHVLLAEDNPVNRAVATGLLAKRGWRVTIATNGREAVDAVRRVVDGREARFDLVLMDVQMPEMDGFAATGAIRALERERGVPSFPIIAVTAHAMAGDRERCLAAGMDAYVAKPLRPAELDAAIASARALRPVVPSPPAAAPDAAAGELATALPADDGDAAADAPPSLQEMAALLDGDMELLRELAGVLLADLPAVRDELRRAVAARDADALRRIAHRIKGSASVFGAAAVSSRASEIERQAGKGATDAALAGVPALERALDALVRALNAG